MSISPASNKIGFDAVKANFETRLGTLESTRTHIKTELKELNNAPAQHSAELLLRDPAKLRSQLTAVETEIAKIRKILEPAKSLPTAKVEEPSATDDQLSDAPRTTERPAASAKGALPSAPTAINTLGAQLAAKAGRKGMPLPPFVKAQFEE